MEEISEGFVFDGGVSIMTWHTLGTVPYKPEEVLNGVYINVTHWEFNLSSWRPNFFHTPLAGVHIYRFITQMLHVWNIGLHQKNTWPHSRGNGIVLFKPSMLFVPWPRLRWKISTVALQPEELQVQKGWTSKCYCWNLGCENPAQVAPSCHSRWPFWRHWWGIRHYGYSTSKIAEIVEIDDELRKIEEFIEPNEDGEYHFEDLFLGTWEHFQKKSGETTWTVDCFKLDCSGDWWQSWILFCLRLERPGPLRHNWPSGGWVEPWDFHSWWWQESHQTYFEDTGNRDNNLEWQGHLRAVVLEGCWDSGQVFLTWSIWVSHPTFQVPKLAYVRENQRPR